MLIQDEQIIAKASHNESKIELAKDLHSAEMGFVEDPFKLILGCLLAVLASARSFSLQRRTNEAGGRCMFACQKSVDLRTKVCNRLQ